MIRRPYARRLALCSLSLTLASALAGCGNKAAAVADEDVMPPNKLAALREGDRLISEGQVDREQGMKLRAEGKDGAALIKQGDSKMTRGEEMKAKGMMLKD